MTELEQAIDTMLVKCNTIGRHGELAELMFEKVSKEHRTIQQSFMRELYEFIVRYSETQYHDLRNEASVEFAKKVEKLNQGFPLV